MLTTVPFDRLTLRRLPWVTVLVSVLWLGAAVYAAAGGQPIGLDTAEVSLPGLLAHWLFPATGAQLAVAILLLALTGAVLEEAWGPAFFAAFLLAMALYTAGVYAAFPPDSTRPLVGSAGMLAAALGACIARQLRSGIRYTVVFWAQRLQHKELWVPAYALPAVWFAGEVSMELAAQGSGPTHGLSYSGQAAGAALGALVGFGLQHFDLEQTWLRRRPAHAPDRALEQARLLLRGGSADAALRTLQGSVAKRPHDASLVAGLCEAAVAAQQPELARAAFLACVNRNLKSGETGLAAMLWKEWAEPLEAPAPDARLTMPLAEALVTRGGGVAAARLLRDLLETPAAVSTGMALRMVEIARPIHAGVAIRAATLALEGGDFPEAKRSRLEAIVRELESRRAQQLDPQLDLAPPSGTDRSIEIALEVEDLRSPPPELRQARAQPLEVPSDWPEEAEASAAAVVQGQTSPDGEARDTLFGSSQETELSAPDAVVDTAPIVQTTPVAAATPASRPGERQALTRKLMPLQQTPAGSPAAPTTQSGPPAAPPKPVEPAVAPPKPVEPAVAPTRVEPAVAPPKPVEPAAAPPKPVEPVVAPPQPDARGARVAATLPRFQDAKCIEAVPVALEGRRLALRQGGAKPGWLELSQVQAVASAGVAGLAERPVVLIDLLLNWRDAAATQLRVVRLRSDRFDPARLLPGAIGGLDGFRAVLDALLTQSGATPLPDARQARGRPFARFDELLRYEREVLGIDR